MARTFSVAEPEWTPDEVALLIMSRHNERDMGSHGIPMSEATDPANQDAFVGQQLPRVDFAEKARLDAQKKYYEAWDKKDNPVNRNGHIWGVTRRV